MDMIKFLFPQVAKSTFGKKMFNRIAPIVERLCDETSMIAMPSIAMFLTYHPGASAPQQMVFNYLAEVALQGNWRVFVATYGELISPSDPLAVLGQDGRKQFFRPM
jgi:hypothetical protein